MNHATPACNNWRDFLFVDFGAIKFVCCYYRGSSSPATERTGTRRGHRRQEAGREPLHAPLIDRELAHDVGKDDIDDRGREHDRRQRDGPLRGSVRRAGRKIRSTTRTWRSWVSWPGGRTRR